MERLLAQVKERHGLAKEGGYVNILPQGCPLWAEAADQGHDEPDRWWAEGTLTSLPDHDCSLGEAMMAHRHRSALTRDEAGIQPVPAALGHLLHHFFVYGVRGVIIAAFGSLASDGEGLYVPAACINNEKQQLQLFPLRRDKRGLWPAGLRILSVNVPVIE